MKKSNFGILLVSFLFPFIGFFIWIAYMDHPRGKDAGIAALCSMGLGILLLMIASA